MSFTNIPEVPNYTGEAPNRTTQQQAEFSANVDDSLLYQTTLSENINTTTAAISVVAEEINAVADEVQVNADAAEASADQSASSANFKGKWVDQSGAANIPFSVFHNGSNWQLLTNLADVTASEPAPLNPNWHAVAIQGINPNMLHNPHLDQPSPTGLIVTPGGSDFDAGDEVWLGVFVSAGGTTGLSRDPVTKVINSITGSVYWDVLKAGPLTAYNGPLVASWGDNAGNPTKDGAVISFADMGDYYRVTLTPNGCFSAKFEQGVIASKHDALNLFDIYGNPADTGVADIRAFGGVVNLTDQSPIVNAIIEDYDRTGIVISVPFNCVVSVDNLMFPDNPSYTGPNPWTAGTRANFVIKFEGSTGDDENFIPRKIIHGFQNDGYWSGERIIGGHNPVHALEAKGIPTNDTLGSVFQQRGGNVSTRSNAGANAAGAKKTMWQTQCDPRNDKQNNQEVRELFVGDNAAYGAAADIDRSDITDTGTVTGSTCSTITDTSQAWTVNQFAGDIIAVETLSNSGVLFREVRRIGSNTADTITIQSNATGDFYYPADAVGRSYFISPLLKPSFLADQALIDVAFIDQLTPTTQLTGPNGVFLRETITGPLLARQVNRGSDGAILWRMDNNPGKEIGFQADGGFRLPSRAASTYVNSTIFRNSDENGAPTIKDSGGRVLGMGSFVTHVTTGGRPPTSLKLHVFDTTLGIPIWSNGTSYVNSVGATV